MLVPGMVDVYAVQEDQAGIIPVSLCETKSFVIILGIAVFLLKMYLIQVALIDGVDQVAPVVIIGRLGIRDLLLEDFEYGRVITVGIPLQRR
jgi:hypothetical protein